MFLKYNSLYLTVSGTELAHIGMKLLTGFKSQSGARHIQGYKATHPCYLPPTDISEIMLGCCPTQHGLHQVWATEAVK